MTGRKFLRNRLPILLVDSDRDLVEGWLRLRLLWILNRRHCIQILIKVITINFCVHVLLLVINLKLLIGIKVRRRYHTSHCERCPRGRLCRVIKNSRCSCRIVNFQVHTILLNPMVIVEINLLLHHIQINLLLCLPHIVSVQIMMMMVV